MVAEINDDLLNGAERSRLAGIVGESQNAIAWGRSDDEGVWLVRITMQFHRRPIEDNRGEELSIFQAFQAQTRRFAAVVVLHVIRIGKRSGSLL
ncbi:MAG: hypothetical protein ABSC42_11570 [Tepidisphaeraceae bacterium]